MALGRITDPMSIKCGWCGNLPPEDFGILAQSGLFLQTRRRQKKVEKKSSGARSLLFVFNYFKYLVLVFGSATCIKNCFSTLLFLRTFGNSVDCEQARLLFVHYHRLEIRRRHRRRRRVELTDERQLAICISLSRVKEGCCRLRNYAAPEESLILGSSTLFILSFRYDVCLNVTDAVLIPLAVPEIWPIKKTYENWPCLAHGRSSQTKHARNLR